MVPSRPFRQICSRTAINCSPITSTGAPTIRLDDLMTQLLNAEIEEDGVSRPLTRTEVLTYTSMIAGAGNENNHAADRLHRPVAQRTPRPTTTVGRGLLADSSGDRGGAAL